MENRRATREEKLEKVKLEEEKEKTTLARAKARIENVMSAMQRAI